MFHIRWIEPLPVAGSPNIATKPTVVYTSSLDRSARPFFTSLFALCLLFVPLLFLVSAIVKRSPGQSLGAAAAAAVVFYYLVLPPLQFGYPLFEGPRFLPTGGFFLLYLAAGVLLVATLYAYVLRPTKDTKTWWYVGVLGVLLLLGLARPHDSGAWAGFTTSRPPPTLWSLPSVSGWPLVIPGALYVSIAAITAGAFAVALHRPRALVRIPLNAALAIETLFLSVWDSLARRRRPATVPYLPGETTVMKKKRKDELPANIEDAATLGELLVNRSVQAAEGPISSRANQKRLDRLNENLKKVGEALGHAVNIQDTDAKLRRQQVRREHVDDFTKRELENEGLAFDEEKARRQANIEEQKARKEQIRASQEALSRPQQPKEQQSRYERFLAKAKGAARQTVGQGVDEATRIKLTGAAFEPYIIAAKADGDPDLAYDLEQERDAMVRKIKRGEPVD